MFNAYEFTFAGESSLMYGLMVYDLGGRGQDDISFGNTAEIAETRINNRIQPIHFGVNYHTKPLEFKLIFGAQRALDRYELENISFWLTGHQNYQWLSISQSDMELVQFRCLVTQLTPISHGWLPVAFEATVTCDCPYAYGYPFEFQYTISGDTDIVFRNESTVREYLKPVLTYSSLSTRGINDLSIVNHSDHDREFLIRDLPASDCSIMIDNNNGIIQDLVSRTNLYDGFNLNFFRLIPGDNNLTISGNGVLTISGRFLYNVAG